MKKKIPQVSTLTDSRDAMERVNVVETAPASKGRTLLLKYLYGDRLSRGDSCLAKCCECMGYFVEGRISCGIKTCPLFPYMPYKKEGV
jgi:hypothetical protein